MNKIMSPSNENFKYWKTLTTSKGLKASQDFLLSGEDLVREFLKNPRGLKVLGELVPEGRSPISSSKYVAELPQKLFEDLDVIGTKFNLLVVPQPLVKKATSATPQTKPSGLEVILPLGDPGNLGAALRSCEAFGVQRVYLTEESAHPFLPKTVKASAGSCYRLELVRGLKLSDYVPHSWGLAHPGENLMNLEWPKDIRLVVGEEGSGLGNLEPLKRISIPISESVESLNATVALSLALYDYRTKQK
jgi:TrmH family RNA methyltransferase